MVRVKKHEISSLSYTKIKNKNNNDDIKSQLVIETYNIYQNSHSSSCIHHIPTHSPFLDWYLILRVKEDASIDTIRKQYHKLALLLHPDKNKHPKAEFAFKLISQAYKCLSDDGKRCSFNLERWRNQCTECSRTHRTTASPSRPQGNGNSATGSSNSSRSSRAGKIQQHFRTLKEQLKEEARIIGSCMRINRASKDEYPVFDPSSYAHLSYPHTRDGHFPYKKAASSWSAQKANIVLSYDQRRGRCEIPIFELGKDCTKLNSTAFVSVSVSVSS